MKKRIAEVRDSIRDHGNHDSRYGIGCDSETMEWEYSQERPYKKDVISGSRRMYLHVYYSVQKAADEEIELNARLDGLRDGATNCFQGTVSTGMRLPLSPNSTAIPNLLLSRP